MTVRVRRYVAGVDGTSGQPDVDHSRRCSQCGDVVMYCSCLRDFIEQLPSRVAADHRREHA